MSADPYAEAARQFLVHEGGCLPDLSAVTVLVPHYHAAQGFLAGLHQVVDGAVFLPPRLLTLPAWAATVPGRPGVEPESRRLADIYGFLKRSGRVPQGQLWQAAAELSGLMRELSDQLLVPPASYAEFEARLEAAYRRGLSAPLGLEARLTFELWHALQQAGVPDAARDYAERLARLADAAQAPLYHLGLAGLTAVERRFFERYEARQPVIRIEVPPGDACRTGALAEVWSEAGAPLRERAAVAGTPSPFVDRLGLCGAASLEAEARAAEAQILAWLAEGRQGIAVVVYDRMTARRLRALLERNQVLVQDETGWTFSTASVSHVLDRWFGLIQDDCYYRDLLDLLKSPYLFADVETEARRAAVAGLERALRRAGVVEGLARFQRLAREAGLGDAAALLERLQRARALFPARRQALDAWQATLLEALAVLGAVPGLESDAAGAQLLALLRRLEAELRGDAATYTYAEWRRWLLLQLDQATFVDDSVESPVRFTHLRAARLRAFDALVLLGADASRLPERPRPGLFNEAVRRELGLPGQAEREAELRAALVDVLGRAPRVLATWQALSGGEPNAPSPWLEGLEVYHRLAYGVSLKVPPLSLEEADVQAADADVAPAPAPGWLPERVGVSAWQSLVNCPYQYYARHLLRLNELDEVAEEMGKRDYGELLHAALARFHARHPRLAEVAPEALAEALAAETDAVFAGLIEGQFLAEAWRLRWRRREALYLEWALAWERAGYRFERAETKAAVEVGLPSGAVRLEGRLDRLDHGPNGAAVIDYKTNPSTTLRAKLKQPGEDVQLPCYAWLAGATEAAFVTLDADKVEVLAWRGDLTEAAEHEAGRFREVFAALAEAAPMPAHGSAKVCVYCEMRGLCRRDYWLEDAPAAP